MPRWIWILLALALAALVWEGSRGPSAPVAQALPGQAAFNCVLPPPASPAVPLQTEVPAQMQPFMHGEFMMSPLAGFSIEARVLGREDYRFDDGASLSPTDLALGWNGMADPAVYRRLDISQSGRWYHYRWDASGPPLPLEEIIRSSANMHLVPANDAVAQALSRVRPDQTVRLQGWLIEARRENYVWRSSTTREDSGAGACELIYVCALSSF
ncbi:MAG: hypothetical protein NT046_09575 [Arenimonas sp.]|nr:hypothetical protein [Arenimonas sp.]